jgi:phage terminase small subunit
MDRTEGLNYRQTLFVEHFLKTGSAGAAAWAAGYARTMGSAYVQGHRLLRNAKVRKVLMAKWDQDRALARAEQLLDNAEREGEFAAAKGTLELICKVAGLMTEARPNPVATDARDISTDDLERIIRDRHAALDPGAGAGLAEAPPSGEKPDRVH